jgi:glycosyltransferase involved in cell wall biosynthesis
MRIFIAAGIFHPESGGPATYLYHLLPELIRQGHAVSALSFGDGPVEGYPYPLTRIQRRNYLLRQWRYFRAAARLWPGHDVAYLHSLGLPLPPAIGPRIAKIVGDSSWERALNKGWIPAQTDIDTYQSARYGPLVEMFRAAQRREARRLDAVIVPSQHRKQMLLGWGVEPGRVHVIYNALDPHMALRRETQSEARQALGLSDGPLLLYVGRLIALKGFPYVFEALQGQAECQLVIAGDGPLQAQLERQARSAGLAERVRFVGRVEQPRLALFYRAADYTLLYSGGEGLSHVLLESLRGGTPVIASDKGGNPEVVRHGLNGLLVPYANVEALSAALAEAFSPGRQADLAAHSADGLERFDWDHMVSRTVEVLQSLV